MSTWTTSAITTNDPPPILWAAKYEALISDDIQQSSLLLNDALPADQLTRALGVTPEWAPQGWPPAATDAESLALAKIKILLDFDAQVDGSSSSDIRANLHQEFPAIAHGGPAARSLRTFSVTALVRLDGQAEWEVFTSAEGQLPAGIPDDSLDSGSPLKKVIQNLARADVLRLLGQ